MQTGPPPGVERNRPLSHPTKINQNKSPTYYVSVLKSYYNKIRLCNPIKLIPVPTKKYI